MWIRDVARTHGTPVTTRTVRVSPPGPAGYDADHQSAAALGANGTAPAEVATTAAGMRKRALAWDKLTLKPLDFETVEEGNYAFVHMTVKWTGKKTELTFDTAMVLAKEAGAWKWVAIDFGAMYLTPYAFR